MGISDRQRVLLRKMVEVVDRGCLSEFFFVQTMSGNALVYDGHPNVPVQADMSDFELLAADRLITLGHNSQGMLRGKPTELGLNLAHSNFAEAGAAKDGAGLLRNQLDKMRAIEELPRDSAEAKLWERNTESVLRKVRGDDKAFEFRQLGQTGEFSPMAEVFADEVEGEETLTRRLREMQRTLIKGELFELEQLSPQTFDPKGYALHPEIERVAGKLYRDGYFRQAAHDAYIRVIEEVKAKAGLLDNKGKPIDGIPLMGIAFDCENNKTPPVRFNDLKTESERDEQQGFMHLFLGLVRLRHSKAHSVRPFDDPSRAHEYLCLASLLMRLLDAAMVEPAESEEPAS